MFINTTKEIQAEIDKIRRIHTNHNLPYDNDTNSTLNKYYQTLTVLQEKENTTTFFKMDDIWTSFNNSFNDFYEWDYFLPVAVGVGVFSLATIGYTICALYSKAKYKNLKKIETKVEKAEFDLEELGKKFNVIYIDNEHIRNSLDTNTENLKQEIQKLDKKIKSKPEENQPLFEKVHKEEINLPSNQITFDIKTSSAKFSTFK